jgi:hypothetical protein
MRLHSFTAENEKKWEMGVDGAKMMKRIQVGAGKASEFCAIFHGLLSGGTAGRLGSSSPFQLCAKGE